MEEEEVEEDGAASPSDRTALPAQAGCPSIGLRARPDLVFITPCDFGTSRATEKTRSVFTWSNVGATNHKRVMRERQLASKAHGTGTRHHFFHSCEVDLHNDQQHTQSQDA